mmetsp:Transcript_49253/g.106977  ORF Transcript_49253/g.106977 Transcript_49253/m.106977 type:complete len:138 (+) Transcript_49253:3-416(+)
MNCSCLFALCLGLAAVGTALPVQSSDYTHRLAMYRHVRPAGPLFQEPPAERVRGNVLPLGIFYSTVAVGTPPQTFNVSLDTGSTDLLVPGLNCDGCVYSNSTTRHYDPSKSSTAQFINYSTSLPDLNCTKLAVMVLF